MRKKIMCLILSLCMVVGVVTGCGSSEDALSDSVTVTQKLEEEYVERMEAYLAYYQEQDTDTTRIGVSVTLDNEHLPIMWLDNEIYSDYHNMQLVSYENGEVKILAEKAIDAEEIYPIYTNYAVVAHIVDGYSEDYDFIVYDDDIKDFRYTSEEELVENYGINIIQDLDPEDYNCREYIIYMNNAKNEIAYMGYVDRDFSDYSSYSDYYDNQKRVPFTIYDYNNEVFQSFDKGKRVRFSTMDFTTGARMSDGLYSYSYEYTIYSQEFAEAFLRYLISHPAYTNGALVTSVYTIEGCTIVDADTLDIDLGSLFEVEEEDFDLSSVETESVEDTNNNEDVNNENTDWLSAYMDCVSENNLYAFVLADIDNSGVPALIYPEGIYKYNGSSVNQVRDNYTTAVKVGDDRSSVLVVCDGSVYGEYVIYNTETFEEQRAFIAEDTTEGYGEWIYYWSDDPDTILSQEEASSVFADLDKKYPVTVFDGYSDVYFDTIDEAYNYYLEYKDVSYSSSTENVVVSSTEETYNELEIYIKHFEVENGRLIIQVDTEDERYKHDDDSIKDGLLDMAISSDCIWGSINVGEAAPTESNKSYEEVKKGIDTARSRYVQDGTYEDARGVSIVVKDGVVMKVYTVAS